ncbi:MAG: ABC transporter substrate-binding protein [Acetatifactor sp.]|nr:ABC transporter substrate-binding protein [Acetatifactor sp.]
MKKNLTKTMNTVIATIAMSLALTGCGTSATEVTSTESSDILANENTETLAVATLSSEPDEDGLIFPSGEPETSHFSIHCTYDYNMSAQVVAAKALGFFDEAGLDVELIHYQSGGEIPTAVIAGDAKVAVGSWSNPMQVASYDVPVKVVNQGGDPSATVSVLVTNASGISQVSELEGCTLATTNAAIVIRALHNICTQYGIDYDGLNLVLADQSDCVTAFANGDVDAVLCWQPFVFNALNMGDGYELINGSYDYSNGETTEVSDIYISGCTTYVTEDFLSANPNTIARMEWALAKATLALKDDSQIDTIAELTCAEMGCDKDAAAANMRAMSYDMTWTKAWIDSFCDETPYYYELGTLNKEIDGNSLIDTSFVKSINPEWCSVD